MLSKRLKLVSKINVRNFKTTTCQNNVKVAVVGASGGIGQPLSLLLKRSPLISKLSLFDIVHTPGVTADLSHMDTPTEVCGFMGKENLKKAVECANAIIVPAGVPRKPGMTRDDLFKVNASIIKEVAEAMADVAPGAVLAIITNPVNSMVPIACEILNKAGKLDPRKIFGVSTLDLVRSSTFVGQAKSWDPSQVRVPVIGGHSGVTIIPVLSQACPPVDFPADTVKQMTTRIQEAGTEVVKAKAGAGSATLSMAHAAERFTLSLVRGLLGEQGIIECSYVMSTCTEATYFSTPLYLGRCGIEQNLGVPRLNSFEMELFQKAIPELKKNIEQGVNFARKGDSC